MSARAATVWFIDSPAPADDLRTVVRAPQHDHQHAQQLASKIYGDSVLVPLVDTDLATAAAAKDHHVYVGFYGSLAVISCSLFETATPSTLTRTLAAIRPSAVTTLLYTEPDTSFGAFARWESGALRRSFSADPVTIHEDHGLPFTFEKPFWGGGEFPLTYAEGVPQSGGDGAAVPSGAARRGSQPGVARVPVHAPARADRPRPGRRHRHLLLPPPGGV